MVMDFRCHLGSENARHHISSHFGLKIILDRNSICILCQKLQIPSDEDLKLELSSMMPYVSTFFFLFERIKLTYFYTQLFSFFS